MCLLYCVGEYFFAGAQQIAAQAGKPALVTSVKGSGMSWVIRNHETGLVVPPGDAPALAGAMDYLVRHEAEHREMGLRAGKRFDTMFKIETVEIQAFDLYNDILSNTGSSPR